ncbi:hypothetical protein SprV_0802462000 [Sparganum proliferum]
MISEEEMKHILEAQQASFMALLTEMQRNWGPASRENKRKQIEQRITEFVYDPEGGVNFEAWFRKYEGLFEEEGAELDDKTKVEIMLLKLAQREHERYVKFIMPQKPSYVSFKDTVKHLKALFCFTKSLFNRRYECFKLERKLEEDYFDLAGRVNDTFQQAELEQATNAQIKALFFIKSLTLPEDADEQTKNEETGRSMKDDHDVEIVEDIEKSEHLGRYFASVLTRETKVRSRSVSNALETTAPVLNSSRYLS